VASEGVTGAHPCQFDNCPFQSDTALKCLVGPRRGGCVARLASRGFFLYYRVSTAQQGASGLGLEA